ncbi:MULTISPECIES: sigma-70 family RNA polymerase sigma factor [Marinobacter]|uniref:Sigma-70 family RNA polymerase sigma factor n=1 Tax=Marinobacter salexigens TaxID=1925763 RepID=A0ABS6A426_9GAMM|nr:sigma-70 family RNA polymerase sigma factor [Marinobacter salexigens]MBU2872892.1 sigma-70 family RNA polymerase sigma factor [Marinobacter salexigens]
MSTPATCVRRVYADHHSWLRGWLQSKTGCSNSAADLAQDTFVRVLVRKRENERLDMQEPRAYLRVIAHGLMVDHFRRKSLEQAFLETLAQQPEPVAFSPLERETLLETLNEVDALLDRLPARARRSFLLSQLDGMTYDEIATQLGVSTRTIKREMKLAFTLLLKALV